MKTYYFAGGGTGGHIFPALAVAEEIKARQQQVRVVFFCSSRPIDARIFSNTDAEYIPLPAVPPAKKPKAILNFIAQYRKSKNLVKQTIDSSKDAVMISIGGFASAPAVAAAKEKGLDIYMLNIDAIGGKANRFCARSAKKVFVQFERTKKYFGKKAVLTGTPLPKAFKKTDRAAAVKKLGLSLKKKTLLITGASAGAQNLNIVMGVLLDKLESFSGHWQIVHISGIANYESVKTLYKSAKIKVRVIDFCDDMPWLLACSDLAVSRAGAMSIAELASTATPAVYLPYPYHKDNHQKLNAEILARAGCGQVVADTCDTEKTASGLWPVLESIMNSPDKLNQMKESCRKHSRDDAAAKIVDQIMILRQ